MNDGDKRSASFIYRAMSMLVGMASGLVAGAIFTKA